MSNKSGYTGTYALTFSNGVEWHITPTDPFAVGVVKRFAECMKLEPVTQPHNKSGNVRIVSVRSSERGCSMPSIVNGSAICTLAKSISDMWERDYYYFSAIWLAVVADALGGPTIFIHSALAEYEENGILFAAPGGGGKTTASRRLPLPWKSLCDDTTVLVRDESGLWMAHPWPTWGTPSEDWKCIPCNVRHSVPVRAIFFLDQSELDDVDPVCGGEKLSMLAHASAQATTFATQILDPDSKRQSSLLWFSHLTEIAAQIPMFRLRLSLRGKFWETVEKTLGFME